jgi:hypothetical protein
MTIGSLSCTLPAARPAGSLRGRLPHCRAQQRLPPLARPSAFRHWRQICPMTSACSSRHPRRLTHRRKLDALLTWMQHIGAGGHERGGKRAVLLAQLAPSHTRDDARLGYSLQLVRGRIRLTAEFRHSTTDSRAAVSPPGVSRTGLAISPAPALTAATPAGTRAPAASDGGSGGAGRVPLSPSPH